MQILFFFRKVTLVALLLFFSYSIQGQDILTLSNTLDSLIENESGQVIITARSLEKLAKKEKSEDYLLKAYTVLAKSYYQEKNYNKSIKYFDKELEIREKSASNSDLLESYYNLGSTCLKLNKNRKAISYFEKSLSKAKEIDNQDFIRANYKALIITHGAVGDYRKTTTYLKKLLEDNEGTFSNKVDLYKKEAVKQKKLARKKTKQLSVTQIELGTAQRELDTAATELVASAETINILEEDTLRKQQQIASLKFQRLLKEYRFEQKEEELKLQKRITFQLVFGLVVISLLAVFVFFLLQSKKKMNQKLSKQKEKIETQNKAITSSIQYASKIQNAILPKEQLFEDSFKEHFVLFKPRDVVSGDFYFLQKVNQYVVFSAVDCTGHGVPGAFLSMLGSAYLNEIIRRKESIEAGQILDLLRRQIKNLLQQTGEKGEQKDGMDMALCILDTNTNELQYAGAYNPLMLVRDGELIEYKGDRMPIAISRKEKPFTNHVLTVKPNDQIYLFSDGFPDQIGGDRAKKYMTKKFKAFLLEQSVKPMAEQKAIVDMEFYKWKGNQKQIDDVTIIAVKV